MSDRPSSRRNELLRVIRSVRARWRRKVALRSATVLVGGAVLTLLAAALGLEWFRFSPGAIVAFRVLTYLTLVGLGWWMFVKPLARRVSDQQVALYLEEHEPSLDAVLVSAVDASTDRTPAERTQASAALLRRLVETAVERCQQIDYGRGIERPSQRRFIFALTGIAVAATVVYVIGPPYLRHGAAALLLPVQGAEAASPYRIDVRPGHVVVPRGADVTIAATLVGFASEEVDLFTRIDAGAPFARGSLVPRDQPGSFEGTLFGLRDSTEYFVEAAGVRSPTFRIEVADLPRVERLELEYVFPAYTGLPPQVVERGGDVVAVRGTSVRLRVHASLPTGGGRLVLDDREETPLAPGGDGTLTGTFEVTRDGFYRIDLQSAMGALVTASPTYAIDALADQEPEVALTRPGRDLRPTSIEEIYIEARAEDDFGVARLDLVYSVNGGPDRRVALVAPAARPLPEVRAGHTLFLEELRLQPGDVVSYYASAVDNDTVGGAKAAASDMYFLEIRPFRKDYRAAESQAAAQQAASQRGSANDPSALSEQQRRIISATFNVARDRERATPDKFREDVVFLTLTQGQLRERVEGLVTQMRARLDPTMTEMRQIADWLASAASAMRAAEERLQARDPQQALPAEQQALGNLLRAEEAYRDVRVTLSNERGGSGAGGGGRQSSPAAEELADLFQLEMDKLRNQYETYERTQQEAADNQLDEMLERLKELARRQEQEAERQRQLAASRQAGAGASAARQRQLAEETEEAARRLERLSREQGRPDLAETARRMREAAEAMRRAAARSDAGAVADASAAAERLGAARDRLQQQRSDRLQRDIERAHARLERLAGEQQAIEREVRSLGQAGGGRSDAIERLQQRKEAQAGEVADIERLLDRTAADFRRERPEAARKVQESADAMRERRLLDKIRYSQGLVEAAPPEVAAGFEEQIGSDIAAVAERLREAAGAAAAPERDRRADALQRARALVRGMETLDQRMRDQLGRQEQGDAAGRQAGARNQAGSQQGRDASAQPRVEQDTGNRGARGEDRTATGMPDRAGGGARRPGQFEPDDVRQFTREARERRTEAEALRRDLEALGLDPAALDDLIRNLRALDDSRTYQDAEEIVRLQSRLVEGFRRVELDLRRAVGATGVDELLLSGSDEAPRAYRKLIEEYYRALAREKKK